MVGKELPLKSCVGSTGAVLFSTIKKYGVSLTPITEKDIETIRCWRNHPEVSRFMFSQDFISPEQQQAWFSSVSQKINECYYMVTFRDQEFGVVYAKSLDNQALYQAKFIEPGLYLDPASQLKSSLLAFAPSLALLDEFFSQGQCEQFTAQVLTENTSALRYNKSLGYVIDSTRSSEEILTMHLSAQQFEQATSKIGGLLSRY